MIAPRWINHDRVEIPGRAEDPETGTIGDALIQIGPEDPRFEVWAGWLERSAPGIRPE